MILSSDGIATLEQTSWDHGRRTEVLSIYGSRCVCGERQWETRWRGGIVSGLEALLRCVAAAGPQAQCHQMRTTA